MTQLRFLWLVMLVFMVVFYTLFLPVQLIRYLNDEVAWTEFVRVVMTLGVFGLNLFGCKGALGWYEESRSHINHRVEVK